MLVIHLIDCQFKSGTRIKGLTRSIYNVSVILRLMVKENFSGSVSASCSLEGSACTKNSINAASGEAGSLQPIFTASKHNLGMILVHIFTEVELLPLTRASNPSVSKLDLFNKMFCTDGDVLSPLSSWNANTTSNFVRNKAVKSKVLEVDPNILKYNFGSARYIIWGSC